MPIPNLDTLLSTNKPSENMSDNNFMLRLLNQNRLSLHVGLCVKRNVDVLLRQQCSVCPLMVLVGSGSWGFCGL